MIISCEQCKARYLLASLLLGSSGRTVRCGSCGHTWFQDAVDEPVSPDSAADDAPASFRDHMVDAEIIDSIPEGVMPSEGAGALALPTDMLKARLHGAAAVTNGLLAAVVVFGLVTGGLILMRGSVVQSWTPAAWAYEVIGLTTPLPGEGLIFDQLTARAVPDDDGVYTLKLEGKIINLRAQPSAIPPIVATLRSDVTDPGQPIEVTLDADKIGPEDSVGFTATQANLADTMKEVNLRFGRVTAAAKH